MSFELRLPDLGEGMAEATVVAWLVAVGDAVTVDQPLVSVETDKMVVDIPSPVAGEVLDLAVAAGDTAAVDEVLVTIAADGAAQGSAPAAPVSAPAPPAAPSPPQPAAAAPGERTPRVKAAPAVRKLAVEQGVDLARLSGSGPGGRVTREDVLAAARADTPTSDARDDAPAPGGPPERVPLQGIRRRIAANLTESWRRIPQTVDFREVDASRLQGLKRRTAGWPESGDELTVLGFVVKVAAVALRRHPRFNSWLDEEREEIVLEPDVNVGIATATPDGLIVPVVRGADRKAIPELSRELRELAGRARERGLTPADLKGGTFTVNNTGALAPLGGGHPLPLINWPQCAILAFGRIADRVVAVDGEAVVRPTMLLTVNADHRLVDGADLVAFTDDVVRLIEQPERLLGILSR